MCGTLRHVDRFHTDLVFEEVFWRREERGEEKGWKGCEVVKMVTCVCVLLAQLEPNNSQSRCVCTQVYCNRKLKETAQEEQGFHRHVCPSSSTIAPVALPPLLAIIASGLGIPHGSRKQQAHSTQSYSQKDPDRV